MPEQSPQAREAEVAIVYSRLREEVLGIQEAAASTEGGGSLAARSEAQRLWAVTAERPYLFMPGRWGRLRGYALLPVKAVMRRLMRWYVEPVATDQRAFNAAALRLVDELAERLAELEERLARLEPPRKS